MNKNKNKNKKQVSTNKQEVTVTVGVSIPVDSTNRPLELFFTTVTRVRDSPCTRKMDKIAGVTAKSCKLTCEEK